MATPHHPVDGRPTAVQLTAENYAEVAAQLGVGLWGRPSSPCVAVRTAHGTVFARLGDWIAVTPRGYEVHPDAPGAEQR